MNNINIQKIDTVYFDMDGVLVDLIGFLEYEEFESIQKISQKIKHSDIVSYLLTKHKEKEPFFNSPPYDVVPKILETIKDLLQKGYRVEILSATPKSLIEEVTSQKTRWLDKHGFSLIPYNFTAGSVAKRAYAREGAFLIDDLSGNIERFIQDGGQGWFYSEKTSQSLLSLLDKFPSKTQAQFVKHTEKAQDSGGSDYLVAKFSQDEIENLGLKFAGIPQASLSKQQKRDNGHYHMTIMSSAEFSKFKHNQTLIDAPINISFLGYGMLEADNTKTHFLVCFSNDAQKLRQNAGLPLKDFHVTVGFDPKDLHRVNKVAVKKNRVIKPLLFSNNIKFKP